MAELLLQEKIPDDENFTEKQILYLIWLLKRIGFTDEKRLIFYLKNVIAAYGKKYKEVKEYNTKGRFWYEWVEKYDSSQCFGLLKHEVAIRKNPGGIKPIYSPSKNISATELANFCFCPVSYSIAKSLDIKFPTNQKATVIGKEFHEELRLLGKLPQQYIEDRKGRKIIKPDPRIKKIRECKLIFAGHTGEKKFFFNEEESFSGQPDYIFQDPKGHYFVVEEKYHAYSLGGYNNHLVQLQAYIKYIQEYDISYGVLLNWSYGFHRETNQPFIRAVDVKIVRKDGDLSLLTITHQNLKTFLSTKELLIPHMPNLNKCASCVVNKYCAHKTGNLKKVTVPYNRSELKLTFVPLPPSLEKKEEDFENYYRDS